MTHDVFVSYSTKDKPVADTIVASLEKNSIRCWYAPRDVEPGDDWGVAITNAIQESKLFLLIFSGSANHTQRVLNEMTFAVTKGKIILPYRIENLEPEGVLKLHLSSCHWLDAFDPSWENHIKRLIQMVSASLGNILKEEDIEILEKIEEKQREQYVKKKGDLGDKAGLQRTLGNQALILQNRGDLDGAMALHKEEERICRELGDKDGLQRTLGNQALILQNRGDLDGAMALHKEEERICRELGNTNDLQKSSSVPFPILDKVHFSITSPPFISPGLSHVVDVWAHLEQHRKLVIERAREEAGGGDIQIKSQGPIKVERGSVLTVQLQIPDLIVEPKEKTIEWEGEIGNATFLITVESMVSEGPRQGQVLIYLNGFQVVQVYFTITVGAGSSIPDLLAQQKHHIQTAFASYASKDQDAVLARIQGLCMALPELDIFFARKDIKSGEKWQERLAHEIDTRDVMYLFWSQAASDSKWVEWEWRRGLLMRGITFIDPCPLVDPEVVPPPKELKELHFGDWTLAYKRTS